MKPCPECKSANVYQCTKPTELAGGELLPKLGGLFSTADVHPAVCGDCGFIRFFAAEDVRKKLATADAWQRISDG